MPRVRSELAEWKAAAAAIPDLRLRAQALDALLAKALNAEAAAVFALLTPRAARRDAIALLVAYQVLTDYLDTLSEEPAADLLRNGTQLHLALQDALARDATTTDYYRHHPRRDDGDYAASLVAFCRARFGSLPSANAVRATALRAARRCGEGQSETHAALRDGPRRIAAWAELQPAGAGYRWWETAAGASSSVAVHALMAIAADPRTSAADAGLVDATYFPSIGALTVLLDNLVDRDADLAAGAHNYLRLYADNREAAERLAWIFGRAIERVETLRRHRSRHAAILAGVAGFYLSAPEAGTPYARPIATRIAAADVAGLPAVLGAMRLRRALRRG